MAAKTKSEDSLRNAAYNAAARALREKHPDEWDTLVSAEYEARGLTYRRRLTPEEKARKVIEDTLAEFPDLRDEFAAA